MKNIMVNFDEYEVNVIGMVGCEQIAICLVLYTKLGDNVCSKVMMMWLRNYQTT